MVNKKNRILIKEKIVEEISKTKLNIKEYKNLNIPMAPDNSIGRVSRMDAINNRSVVDVALRKAKLRLKNLQITEKEIEHKDFGICIRCKKDIPLGRLLLVPESKKCVQCA